MTAWSRSVTLVVSLGVTTLLSGSLAGAVPDTRLVDAARRGDAKAVQTLLGEGVNVNLPQPDGATALHWAAHRDDLAMADMLIRAGADVNVAEDGGVMPLAVACGNGSVAMVDRLLTAGANPNLGRESAVMAAARSGNVEVMTLLLARGGRRERQGGVARSDGADVVRCGTASERCARAD